MKRRGLLIFLLLIFSIFISLFEGSVRISLGEIMTGSPVFWKIRLPRIINAFMVGASLSLSGSVLQALFRNPLAEPYLLGVSAGAAVGVSISILLKLAWSIELCSFLGSMFSLILVYKIAVRNGFLPTEDLLLAGVAINALLSALLGFLMYMVGRELHGLLFWMWGSFGTSSWDNVIRGFPIFLFTFFLLVRHADDLNIMLWGDEHALQMGVDVRRVKKSLLISSSLITAISVASSGIIGFVGLVTPHIVRIMLGPDHKVLLPFSVLLGGGILVLADALSRSLVSPAEVPVGLITALGGAPFFIYLLRKWRKSDA